MLSVLLKEKTVHALHQTFGALTNIRVAFEELKPVQVVCKPHNFRENLEGVMTNYDHSIDENVAEKLRKKYIFAQYSGWNFCGYVWWNRILNKWSCEIWQYNSHIGTIHASTLHEIMHHASWRYGSE